MASPGLQLRDTSCASAAPRVRWKGKPGLQEGWGRGLGVGRGGWIWRFVQGGGGGGARGAAAQRGGEVNAL